MIVGIVDATFELVETGSGGRSVVLLESPETVKGRFEMNGREMVESGMECPEMALNDLKWPRICDCQN